ncbi:MAG: ABC transporter permease, partial [Planctomycetota bacterium]
MTRQPRTSPLRIALAETRRHPVRTLLVAQGMVWAIALVVAPAAIIHGSQTEAVQRARELGTDMIQIGPTDDAKKDPKLAAADADLPYVRQAVGSETEMTALRLRAARLAEIAGPVWLLGSDDAVSSLRNLDTIAGTLPSLAAEGSTGREPIPVALEWNLARRLLETDEPTGTKDQQDAARRSIGSEILGSVITLERTPARVSNLEFHAAGSEGATESKPNPQQLVLRVDAVVTDSVRRKTDVFGTSGEKDFAELVRDVMQLFGVASNPAPWMADGTGIYLPRRHVPGSQLDWIMVRTHPLEVSELSDEIENALV